MSKRIIVLGAALITVAGCSQGEKPGPLAPQFGTNAPRTQKEMAADPLSGADRPGALYPNIHTELTDAQQPPNGPGVAPLSKTVQENVIAPGTHADDAIT